MASSSARSVRNWSCTLMLSARKTSLNLPSPSIAESFSVLAIERTATMFSVPTLRSATMSVATPPKAAMTATSAISVCEVT